MGVGWASELAPSAQSALTKTRRGERRRAGTPTPSRRRQLTHPVPTTGGLGVERLADGRSRIKSGMTWRRSGWRDNGWDGVGDARDPGSSPG